MIPAPLLSRHTAVAVVVVSVPASAVTLALFAAPDQVWWFRVAPLVYAVQGVVLALAVFLIARTLAPRTAGVLLVALTLVGGFLLAVLVLVVGTVLSLAGLNAPPVLGLLLGAAAVAATLIFLGLLVLGVIVVAHGSWRGPTRYTLIAAALVTPVVVVGAVAASLPVLFAVWSLVFLGLVGGLRAPREVPDVGVPSIQLGAAEV